MRSPAEPSASSDRLTVAVPRDIAGALGVALLGSLVLLGAFVRERRRLKLLRDHAFRDATSGLRNRGAFDHQLALEWERFSRYGRPVALIVIDLDGFKRTNDEHGHAEGDRVLAKAGEVIAGRVRRSDLSARIGGDEFAVITTETQKDGLKALAADVKNQLRAEKIAASVGWAEADEEIDRDAGALLHRADLAMYESKRRAARRRAAAAKRRNSPGRGSKAKGPKRTREVAAA